MSSTAFFLFFDVVRKVVCFLDLCVHLFTMIQLPYLQDGLSVLVSVFVFVVLYTDMMVICDVSEIARLF